jgi:23S rRNA (uracil1939-C5)-methyltransferase
MTQTNAKSTATLEIDALSYCPYGIGRLDGKAIMVPYTAPGDTVEVRITEEKERYAVGEATRVLRPSLLRQAPPCPYVGACGGCSWQHLGYDAQLKAKQQSVVDALHRIGKLGDFELKPIIPSAQEYGYRRRVRLQLGPKKELGFFGAASHVLVEIGSCLIADDRLNRALDSLRRWVRALATPIEYVEIVAGDEPEEIVVVARAIGPFAPSDEPACANLTGEGEQIRGLIVAGADWRRVWGRPAISVNLLADLSLSLDADVFMQVNAEGNRRILNVLLAAGDFQSGDRVLEL